MDGGGFDDDDNPFLSGGFFSGMASMNILNPNRGFDEMYRCFPIAMMQRGNDRENVKYGGKIVLPQSALEKLTKLNISYPMLFRLDNKSKGTHSHTGVLEFIAEEGRAYLPQWMMDSLGLNPHDHLHVKNVTLPLGSFVKIQPQSTDFLDISDPKAVLENALRNFSTLTTGDIFQIGYNNKVYEIKVLEVKPDFADHSGISIVETDLEVDFAAPLGYKEPEKAPKPSTMSQMKIDNLAPKSEKSVFGGEGKKLKNKGKAPAHLTSPPVKPMDTNDTPPIDPNNDGPLLLPFGQLYFGFPVTLPKGEEEAKAKPSSFTGQGRTLRERKPRKP